jgi:hypothetical protein
VEFVPKPTRCGIMQHMSNEPSAEGSPSLIGETEFMSSVNMSAGSIAKAVSDGAMPGVNYPELSATTILSGAVGR